MQFQLLSLAFAAIVSAQSITEVLEANKATLSTLTSLVVGQPAILRTLDNAEDITVFAPTNAAFAAFLNTTAGAAAAKQSDVVAALLTYHVVNGNYPAKAFTSKAQFLPTLLTSKAFTNVTGGQRVEAAVVGSSVVLTSGLLKKSTVVVANVKFDGGVIHVIDSVLTIPSSPSDTAVAAGLTSLAGALTKAGLVATVNGLKDITVFAPTNAAFEKIATTAASLTTAQLTSVLTYHVVAGAVAYSTSLKKGVTSVKTVNGQSVKVNAGAAGVTANDAKVVTADVLVSNGVVHVIDAVLLPASMAKTTYA